MAEKKARSKKQNNQVSTEGGAYLGGNVQTGGGDFVGRDKIISGGERSLAVSGDISGSTLVTGDGNVVVNTRTLFAPVYRAIQRSSRPAQEKTDLAAEVKDLETEVQKGAAADEGFLARRLRTLKRMAPDIGELLLSALSGPGAVVSTLVKKVAERVKSER